MNFCVRGICSGSVCVQNSLADCQCTEVETERCDVCCIFNGVCTSTFQITGIEMLAGQRRDSGRSCNDFTGYCDSDGK